MQPQSCHGLLSTAKRSTYAIASISKTTKNVQNELSGQHFENENVSHNAVLRHHNKSKMADGCHFGDR